MVPAYPFDGKRWRIVRTAGPRTSFCVSAQFSVSLCRRHMPLSFSGSGSPHALTRSTRSKALFCDGHHSFCVKHFIQSDCRGDGQDIAMKRTMQRSAYNVSIPDSLTMREQGITRLTCLRLYREFADACRWLARFAQTLEERKVLQDMEAALTNTISTSE